MESRDAAPLLLSAGGTQKEYRRIGDGKRPLCYAGDVAMQAYLITSGIVMVESHSRRGQSTARFSFPGDYLALPETTINSLHPKDHLLTYEHTLTPMNVVTAISFGPAGIAAMRQM